MTKDEILRLHTLSEDEQEKILIDNKILESLHFKLVGCKIYESLADCAFRLSKEANEIGHIVGIGDVYCSALIKIKRIMTPKTYDPMETEEWMYFWEWWARYASEINKIQAALLAKLEAKGE